MDSKAKKVYQEIETNKNRMKSAWMKGVWNYALELLDEDWVKLEGKTSQEIKTHLLNGARNWDEYSQGGCSLVYDYDIAQRLCTPSELKKNRNGERNPNAKENWIDCQARALNQAWWMIKQVSINIDNRQE